MLKVVNGDLLTAFDDGIPAIGHQVNCQGVMGAGLARQIRNHYPKVYEQYKMAYNGSPDLLGKIQPILIDKNKTVVNLFAQDGYGRNGLYTDYNALSECLSKLRNYVDHNVALPFGLGAGLAGGDWNRIYNMIENIFANSDKKLFLYKFRGE